MVNSLGVHFKYILCKRFSNIKLQTAIDKRLNRGLIEEKITAEILNFMLTLTYV